VGTVTDLFRLVSKAQRDQRAGKPWRTPMARTNRDRLEGDELHGMIFIHGGDDSEFVAKKVGLTVEKPKR